jgi:hypothetical protein
MREWFDLLRRFLISSTPASAHPAPSLSSRALVRSGLHLAGCSGASVAGLLHVRALHEVFDGA